MVMNNERWMKTSSASTLSLFADRPFDSPTPLTAAEAAGPEGAERKPQGHHQAETKGLLQGGGQQHPRPPAMAMARGGARGLSPWPRRGLSAHNACRSGPGSDFSTSALSHEVGSFTAFCKNACSENAAERWRSCCRCGGEQALVRPRRP